MQQQQQQPNPYQYGQMNGGGFQQHQQRGGPRSTLNAEERCKNKIFIGGLDPATTKENLEQYFSQYGTIIDAVVMTDATTQRSRGFGFVTFDAAEPLDAVQNARPHTVLNKVVDTRRAMPRDQVLQKEDNNKDSSAAKKVFVGGINKDTTDDQFRDYCSAYGPVESIFVQRKGERHYGFCTFEDFDSADKMILHKEHQLNGSTLQVKKAMPKSKLNASNNSMNNSMGSFGAPYQPMAPAPMGYNGYPQVMPQMGAQNAWRPNQPGMAGGQARPGQQQQPYAYAQGGYPNMYLPMQQQQQQTGAQSYGAYGRPGATATGAQNPSGQTQNSGYQYPGNQSYSGSK